MLDFVPNHTALDHPWVQTHPEFYIQGSEDDSRRAPQNYLRVETPQGPRMLAYGRDPYFSGWPDTLQLNYADPACRRPCRRTANDGRTLRRCPLRHGDAAAARCLPTDMGHGARAVLAEGDPAVRQGPGFSFMAEVYWDLEWILQQQGFDYTYDKRLYDRLREGQARPVRDHFRAGMEYQDELARFLENHDEPRAAATFPARITGPPRWSLF